MSKIREQFRSTLAVKNILGVMDLDPNYEYKDVIFTYSHDPGRVDRYYEEGWEIVETDQPVVDDRSFTANSKEKKLRKQPRITKTKCGHEQVLMRIPKDKWIQNQLDKKKQRDELHISQAKRRGEKIVKRGNDIITTGTELTENI